MVGRGDIYAEACAWRGGRKPLREGLTADWVLASVFMGWKDPENPDLTWDSCGVLCWIFLSVGIAWHLGQTAKFSFYHSFFSSFL